MLQVPLLLAACAHGYGKVFHGRLVRREIAVDQVLRPVIAIDDLGRYGYDTLPNKGLGIRFTDRAHEQNVVMRPKGTKNHFPEMMPGTDASNVNVRVSAYAQNTTRLALRINAPTHDLPEQFTKLNEIEEKVHGTSPYTLLVNYAKMEKDLHGVHHRIELGKHRLKRASNSSVKLVLGVVTLPSQISVIHAHFATWMQKPGVCEIARHDDPSCQVFPVFVYGNMSKNQIIYPSWSVILPGVTEADENRLRLFSGFAGDVGYDNKGKDVFMWKTSNVKTPAWFQYAANNFEWATHVGKMDLDTYPHIAHIVDDIAALYASAKDPIYYGKPFDGGFKGLGGMYGEFYVLDKLLVDGFVRTERNRTIFEGVNDPDTHLEFARMWFGYAEDQLMHWVLFHAEQNKNCPHYVMAEVYPESRWEHPVR